MCIEGVDSSDCEMDVPKTSTAPSTPPLTWQNLYLPFQYHFNRLQDKYITLEDKWVRPVEDCIGMPLGSNSRAFFALAPGVQLYLLTCRLSLDNNQETRMGLILVCALLVIGLHDFAVSSIFDLGHELAKVASPKTRYDREINVFAQALDLFGWKSLLPVSLVLIFSGRLGGQSGVYFLLNILMALIFAATLFKHFSVCAMLSDEREIQRDVQAKESAQKEADRKRFAALSSRNESLSHQAFVSNRKYEHLKNHFHEYKDAAIQLQKRQFDEKYELAEQKFESTLAHLRDTNTLLVDEMHAMAARHKSALAIKDKQHSRAMYEAVCTERTIVESAVRRELETQYHHRFQTAVENMLERNGRLLKLQAENYSKECAKELLDHTREAVTNEKERWVALEKFKSEVVESLIQKNKEYADALDQEKSRFADLIKKEKAETYRATRDDTLRQWRRWLDGSIEAIEQEAKKVISERDDEHRIALAKLQERFDEAMEKKDAAHAKEAAKKDQEVAHANARQHQHHKWLCDAMNWPRPSSYPWSEATLAEEPQLSDAPTDVLLAEHELAEASRARNEDEERPLSSPPTPHPALPSEYDPEEEYAADDEDEEPIRPATTCADTDVKILTDGSTDDEIRHWAYVDTDPEDS